MDATQKQQARNETLFREVNERVEEVSTGLAGYGEDDALLIGFVCECGDPACSEQVDLTRAQYESVRNDPRHFFVVPGHENADVARVVERHAHYVVAEKIGEAAEIAIDHDPRS